MIVADGRTDIEKLRELLTAKEETHLDFKKRLNLSVKKDELSLIKDIVTMSNRPEGGYILIGVDDHGPPCCPVGTHQRSDFDGANLGQKVRNYVESDVQVITAVHELDGHEIVLIYVQPHADGLPVPMSKLGQYKGDEGKDVVVFRAGEIFVREGPANVPIRHCHWRDILRGHERLIREQAQADAQALIGDFVKQLHPRPVEAIGSAPLLADMSEDAFAQAVVANLEAGNDVRIRAYLTQARNLVLGAPETNDDVGRALDQIAVIAAQGLLYERFVETRLAIETLFEIYMDTLNRPGSQVLRLVEVLESVYALGGLAVRLKRWSIIHDTVQRPVRLPDGAYTYSSWLRHGQVQASRANLFPDDRGGLLISAARALSAQHPALRPDVPPSAIADFAKLERHDVLLNSLCQFDLAYCLIAAAEGEGHARGYPSCSAFDQHRADPILETIASESAARQALFPNSTDAGIAQAITDVVKAARGESLKFGAEDWGDLPPKADAFVRTALNSTSGRST